MNPGKIIKSKRAGSAMPLAMLAVVVLLLMGTGLLSLGLNRRIFSIRTTSALAARSAADAGLTAALFEMNKLLHADTWDADNLPSVTDQTLPGSAAVFSYTVTSDADTYGAYAVEATGKCGGAEKTITSIFRLQVPFDFAVFGADGFTLKEGTLVDWYNYTANTKKLQIGCNSIEPGAIRLNNNVIVNGNIVVGPGGNPAEVIDDFGATITGWSYPLTRAYEPPPAEVPDWLLSLPSQGTIQENITMTASAKYDSINLKTHGAIIIDGAVTLYVAGDVTLGSFAEVRIDNASPDASLTLYLGGQLDAKNATGFNNLTQDAKKLKLYGLDSCESIILKNGSDFYGAVYTPNASLEMKNSANIYGSIVAKFYEQKNSATFNYDASLREVTLEDTAIYFTIEKWRE